MNILLTFTRFIAKLLSPFVKSSHAAGGEITRAYVKPRRNEEFMIMGPMHLLFDRPLSLLDNWGDPDQHCVCTSNQDAVLVDSDCPRHGHEAVLNRAMQYAAEENAIISKAGLVRRTTRAEARMRARHRRFPS